MERNTVNILSALREATRQQHADLDSHPLLYKLSQNQDPEALAGLLQAFSVLLPPALAASQAFLSAEELEKIDYQSWLDALDKDLAGFGRDRLAPGPGERPWFNDVSSAFGLFYVLEGSALGGAELAKGFVGKAVPLGFLGRGQGEGRLRWPYFCKLLKERGDSLEQERSVKAAQESFMAMTKILNRLS